ncbi:hypothetical protein HPB50_009292 [Hyalomma asiaticum]|uniref:Uncharacterized protein n=1 Tax=Hyalomma asiaticum TaxID=266040 RepID=A0ACB7TF74_HYAAI|nr:hypothetical protein HPB50_009292 [Hyalomma asiaticum]
MLASVCSVQEDIEGGLADAPFKIVAASRLRVRQNSERPSMSVAEGESERDGRFFSFSDVVAPHGSTGTFCECVVHDCGHCLGVRKIVVGGVNIVRGGFVPMLSFEGFHSGFPAALMQSGIHVAGDGGDFISGTKVVGNGLAASSVLKLADVAEA